MPATLTQKGADGFAGFYPAGTQLDPVTITIAKSGATLPNSPPVLAANVGKTGLASTGATPWPLTIAGVLLLAIGAATLVLQRRRAG